MKFKDTFILLAVFSAVIIGSIAFYENGMENYGIASPSKDSAYGNLSTGLETTSAFSQDMTEKLQTGGKPSGLDLAGLLLEGGYALLLLPLNALTSIVTMISTVNAELGFPPWVTSLLLTIITISIVSLVLALITNRSN